jgi:flagellar biosynthesis protein FlhB
MSSSDLADRTLPPTERRRREARSRGEIPRSSELTAAVVLLAASCSLWFAGTAFVNAIARLLQQALVEVSPQVFDVDMATVAIHRQVVTGVSLLWPFFLVLVVCGIGANLIQTGWLWVPSAIQPRLRQGTLLSWPRLGDGLFRILKFAVLLGIAWQFLQSHHWQFRSAAGFEPIDMMTVPVMMFGELCARLSICLIIFALVDYGLKYWRHEQNLKMTIEERRREQREEEIDREIKRRQNAAPGASGSVSSLPGIERISSAG